ncbi:MAG TPA: hypothetical protein VII63_07715 [Caulobacteraceae bacterium]
MVLTARQFSTLRNLARKQAGEDVDWINIADARHLTNLGLAERTREGWRITSAGGATLAAGGSLPDRAQESVVRSLTTRFGSADARREPAPPRNPPPRPIGEH